MNRNLHHHSSNSSSLTQPAKFIKETLQSLTQLHPSFLHNFTLQNQNSTAQRKKEKNYTEKRKEIEALQRKQRQKRETEERKKKKLKTDLEKLRIHFQIRFKISPETAIYDTRTRSLRQIRHVLRSLMVSISRTRTMCGIRLSFSITLEPWMGDGFVCPPRRLNQLSRRSIFTIVRHRERIVVTNKGCFWACADVPWTWSLHRLSGANDGSHFEFGLWPHGRRWESKFLRRAKPVLAFDLKQCWICLDPGWCWGYGTWAFSLFTLFWPKI